MYPLAACRGKNSILQKVINYFLKLKAENSYSDGAAHFSSANKEYLTIPSNTSLQTGDIDFEVGAWVRLDSVGINQIIMAKYNEGVSGEFQVRVTNANKVYCIIGSATLTSTETLSANTWYFIRAWRNKTAGTVNVSVNNGVATSASASAMSTVSVPFMIGAYLNSGTTSTFLNGRIDSPYFKKGISTPDEATALYNAGAGRTYSDLSTAGLNSWKSNLVSWWDLNEEEGIRYDAHGTNHLTPAAAQIIAPPTYGSELIVNGGFETTGSGGYIFSNWQQDIPVGSAITIEGVNVHSGNAAAKLTRTTATGDLYQVFTVIPGANYNLSYWAKSDGTNQSRHKVFDVTNNADIVPIAFNGVSATAYTLVSVPFTAPTGCTSVRIILYGTLVNDTYVYFDDISVKQITTPAINNGGFESLDGANNFSNWSESAVGGSTINDETDPAHVYSGSHALRMSINASDYAHIAQNVLVTGKKYKITIYAKGTDGTVSFGLEGLTLASQGVTNSYAPYTYTLTATAGTLVIKRISIYNRSLWIDNITLESLGPTSDAGIAAGVATDGNFAAQFNENTLTKTSNASLQSGNGDFTIWSWVNFDQPSVGTNFFASKYNATLNKREYGLAVNSNTFYMYTSTDGITPVNAFVSGVTPGIWYLLVGSYDSVAHTLNLWVNGISSTPTPLASMYQSDADFIISGQKQRADGTGIIRRLLTDTEKSLLYNNGKGLKYSQLPVSIKNDSNLKGFWNLDEKSGTRYDSTVNGNNLTDNGTVTQAHGINYNEGIVSKIIDQSSNANNFLQINPFKRPAYDSLGINNAPALLFDSLDDGLVKTGDIIGTGDVTITTVIKPRGWGGSLSGRIIDNGKFSLMVISNVTQTVSVTSNNGTRADSAGISLNSNLVITVTRKSDGITNIYINGALSGTANQNSNTPVAGSDTYIGNRAAGDRAFDGWIGDTFIFKKILTPSERARVERSLATKYGITI